VNENKVAHNRRHRGAILQLIRTNHEDQLSRMDDLALWGLMQDLNFGLGQNAVLTLLQDLCSRGYLRYDEKSNRISGRTEISRIELTALGTNVVERLVVDPAVLIP
jgi:hypothetical protein